MAFVEGVFCKRRHRFEDVFRVLFRKSASDSTGAYFVAIFVFFTENKGVVLLFHLSAFLFRHGAADDICASEGKSRKFAAYAHDLFLIYNTAGSGGEYIFQYVVFICYRFGILPVFQKQRNGIHGTGAVKRYCDDDILDVLRLHFR